MPANVSLEYSLAERRYREAKNDGERLKALNEMLSKAPTHKGGERLRQELKTKIARLRERIEKSKKKKGKSIGIRKEGAAQVCLVGMTNSGKSFLLNRLTNSRVEISGYEFTTKKPEIGIMDYNGVKIQIIEIPAVFRGCGERYAGYFSIVRGCDLVVYVLDGISEKSLEEQLNVLDSELENSFIDVKRIVFVNKVFKSFRCKYVVCEDLKKCIWRNLDLIYVYTKMPGKEKDYPPVALRKGSCVRDLALVVHKDFVRNFRFARVWGESVKYSGAQVGLEHELKEGDVVEFHLK